MRFGGYFPGLGPAPRYGFATWFDGLQVSGQGEDTARLGARRKERYVFTRRGLLSFIEYLASPFGLGGGAPSRRAVREALLRYYRGRVSSAADQRTIVQLVEAAGLG